MSGRNGNHEWFRITNAFILCDLLYINLMIIFLFSWQFHFCWESSTIFSHRLQMKYICYWCWAEINMHLLCNFEFIVWQFAKLNFPSIMQALKKCSPNVKYIILLQIGRNMQFCYTFWYFVRNLSGEHILFWKTYYSQFFNQSIFHSVFQSTPPFSNTYIRCHCIYSVNLCVIYYSHYQFFLAPWCQMSGSSRLFIIKWKPLQTKWM